MGVRGYFSSSSHNIADKLTPARRRVKSSCSWYIYYSSNMQKKLTTTSPELFAIKEQRANWMTRFLTVLAATSTQTTALPGFLMLRTYRFLTAGSAVAMSWMKSEVEVLINTDRSWDGIDTKMLSVIILIHSCNSWWSTFGQFGQSVWIFCEGTSSMKWVKTTQQDKWTVTLSNILVSFGCQTLFTVLSYSSYGSVIF